VPRALTSADRKQVFATLVETSTSGSVVALRTRALITLAVDTGLRVGELCALELAQLLCDAAADAVRLQESFYLRHDQAKGGDKGAGVVHVPKRARAAVRLYVLALRREQWIPWPVTPHIGGLDNATPLFLGHRGQRGRPGHNRLSVRAAQRSWHELQAHARLSTRYSFHALRHDCASRLRAAGADLFDLAKQLRWRDLSTAQRYVHDLDGVSQLPLLAARAEKL
jgi:integrase